MHPVLLVPQTASVAREVQLFKQFGAAAFGQRSDLPCL